MPVNSVKSSSSGDSKLRSELTLLQRKYNRLEQKEKRIQVNSSFKSFLKILDQSLLFSNYVVNGKTIMITINSTNFFRLSHLVREQN
jgi:hypothetical protein